MEAEGSSAHQPPDELTADEEPRRPDADAERLPVGAEGSSEYQSLGQSLLPKADIHPRIWISKLS